MNEQQSSRLVGTGRAWVYKVRADAPVYAQASGEWLDFFQDDASVWGGSWATKNAESRFNFGELRPGDRIWAYQAQSNEPQGSRVIIGLAEVVAVTASKEHPSESDLILRPVIRLTTGLRIHEVRSEHPILRTASAFLPGHAGTLYELEPKEHRAILELCNEQRLLPDSMRAHRSSARESLAVKRPAEGDRTIHEAVKAPDGAPAAGVEVYVEEHDGSYWHAATTDEQGRFLIRVNEDMPVAAVLLLDPRHQWSGCRLDVGLLLGDSPHRHRPDHISLRPTTEVSGHVRDADGHSAPGMLVTAVPSRKRPKFEHGVTQTVTTPDGHFVLSGVWREPVMIEVAAPGRLDECLSTPIDAALVRSLELQLPQLFTLDIEIRDDSGAYLEGADVWIGGETVGTRRVRTTDGYGRARFEGLPADRYLIAVGVPDARFAHTNVEVEVPHQQEVAISLRPSGSITGVVLGSGQRPSPGALVQAVGFLDPEDASATMPMAVEAITDAQGRFALEGLSARSYLLSVIGTGEHEKLGCQRQDVPSGTRDLRLILRPEDDADAVR